MSLRSPVRETVLMFPIQFGKALWLKTPIPTPTGWTTMGEIRVGDWVLGDDGCPVRVCAASDVFTDHPCYRLTFSDGAQVVADAGHRWQVVDLQQLAGARKEMKRRTARDQQGGTARKRKSISFDAQSHILTTAELSVSHRIRGAQSRYAVSLTAPLCLPDAALPIDPYLLGVWLGDGHSYSAGITMHEDDAPHIVAKIEAKGYFTKVWKNASDLARDSKAINALVNPKGTTSATFYGDLKAAELLKNKHIPCTYLRASHAQRLALLQGLLDTDGHAASSGSVEISCSYPALAVGIMELARSLGYKPVIKWRKTSAKDAGRITFMAYQPQQPFSLPRKLSALPNEASERGADAVRTRYITSVELTETVSTRCIAVDNASHLFLCGHEFIPTHNTEVAINALGYCMDHDPGPIMVCLPGEVSMNKWVAQKLNPMVDESPAVKRALTSVASRDSANTRTFKDFAGGQLYMEHAGSPSRLKSTTVRTLLVDEVDEFSNNLSGGDDPLEMLKGRTSAFPSTSKSLYISSPQIKGLSRIEQLWNKSDQRRYHVPCPHCGHMQHLQWPGLHWSPDGKQVWYVCQECGATIDEHHKTTMITAGQWVPDNPGAKMRGYHINCLYYQFGLGPRWADLVETWRDVQNEPARLKTFVNDRLAEPWEDAAMRAVKHNAIADRAEAYPLRTAPLGVLCITAGIDTQNNRLAVQIIGWGRDLSFWVLDYVELPGDPASDEVWTALTELLNTPILHASGALMRVEAMANDAGGHRTEDVKNYVRTRRVRRPMAIFGAVPNNAPVLSKGKLHDVDWRGRSDKRGVMMYHVGTVGSKHWLYSRLSTDADKSADVRTTHFSDQLPPEYFPGLVSETYDPTKNRFINRRGARNEPLDTWVYAYAAAHHPELRLHRHTKADWDKLEARYAAKIQVTPPSSQQETSAHSYQHNSSTPSAPASPPAPRVSHGKISLAGLRR